MQSRPDVLIVHSDSIVIQTLSLMLASLARIRFSLSAKDALAQIRADVPELLMLEVSAAGSQGLDLLRQIRAEPVAGAVPVIALTDHADPVREAPYYELRPIEFLAKPLSAPQVVARVRDQLRLHRFEQIAASRVTRVDTAQPPSTILVVDDDRQSIQLLGAALSQLKCQIRFALDGESALAMMAREVPDVVLMDVQMPGMDGIAVCRAMQDDPVLRSVPVCVITRSADPPTEARALEAGAVDFISKPYRPAILLARVRNLLRIKDNIDSAMRDLSRHWQQIGDHRVAAMVDAASDAILSTDARGHVVLINEAACTLLGVRSADMLGRPLSELPDAQVIAPLMDASTQAAAALAGMPRRIRLGQAWGGAQLVEPTTLHFGDGEHRITTLTLRNVSERARAEAAEQEHMAAQASNRTKSMMLSYMAHEFATPFNAIVGMTNLVLSDEAHPLDDSQRRRIAHVHTAASQLWSMMRDLLDFGRAESQGFAVKLAILNVVEEIHSACDLVAGQAATAGIRIEPLPTGVCSARADKGRLGQCLLNLLTNAIKYNRPGGSVRISVRAAAGQVHIEVADTGIGMDEPQFERLFHAFDRLGRENSDVPGTGLGLVITRLLVEAMGGDISASSKAGEGSQFTISLKAAEANVATA